VYGTVPVAAWRSAGKGDIPRLSTAPATRAS
jgi:hypothetical protein